MARSSLINDNSLMQPFFVGTPRGSGKNGDEGQVERVADWRFKLAFPDCRFNKNLPGDDADENLPDGSYESYLKRKMGW